MGWQVAESLPKTLANYDEFAYSTGTTLQETTVALSIVKPIKQPVNYVSHASKDAKTRYPRVERVCLAIVYASQRPCHYFLPYKVHLMTESHAIMALLWQPIFFGKISQWLL